MRAFSLRAKVFFLFAVAGLLIVVPTLVLIARAVEERVYERSTAELATAATAIVSFWGNRDESLGHEADATALEPELAAAWQAGDLRRAERVLRRRLEKDRVAILVDSAGETLLGPKLDPGALGEASKRTGTMIALPADDRVPIRVAVRPVKGDSATLGWVGVGTELGPGAVQALKKDLVPGTDLVLMVEDSLIGSTLSADVAPELAAIDVEEVGRRPLKRQIDGRWYIYTAIPLPVRGAPASVLLFRPVGDELRVVEGIRQSLWGIGLAALIVALLLALLVSRIVARPAQVLAAASARLAEGDYRAPLPAAASDEIGRLARAFGEMRSAIAERESRLRSAQAEMIHREKLAAMGRLVAQLSHEINNPIYNIQNCLEALERRGDPTDPNREFLTLAQEELRRMTALTRRLLDQSRPLADDAAALDLNDTVRRVAGFAEAEARNREIDVVLDLDPALPEVTAHPEAIQQVLANLVGNAVDAMPHGGRLTLRTRTGGDAVEVAVEDTGAGIPEDQRSRIFEAFYTTKPGVRGIGLGLFVSDGIVRGHRGRLTVESEVGVGSRFVVRLPRETLDRAVQDDRQAAVA